MVPSGRPLIVIGYKYNARRVLYFIVTENAGITKTSIPYLSKYSEKFTNVAINPVSCPLVISKTFLMLMRLTPTTNKDILIWHWRSGGLLSVVGCGYILQLLWEQLLLIVGNCFVVGLRETTMTN